LKKDNIFISQCGSHLPLQKATISVFDVNGILELGAGFSSTPYFYSLPIKSVSVETNKDYIAEIKDFINFDEKIYINSATMMLKTSLLQEE